MTDEVRPIAAVSARDRRAADRRAPERRDQAASKGSASREIVPVGEPLDHAPDPARLGPAVAAARPEAPGSAAAFAAQLMGQTGQRKGLRGGPPVLDAARSSYLNTEYSGDNDRRPPSGKGKRTDV